jgi:hypothetical protein
MKLYKKLLLLLFFLILLICIILWKSVKNENYIKLKNTHSFKDKYSYENVKDKSIEDQNNDEDMARSYEIKKEKQEQRTYTEDILEDTSKNQQEDEDELGDRA